MNNKHEINYFLIYTVMSVISLFIILFVALLAKESVLYGIIFAAIVCAARTTQLFVSQRVKSVTVGLTSIIIEYGKESVELHYEDLKKIEHYKYGPLTERICIYANDNIYEIPFD